MSTDHRPGRLIDLEIVSDFEIMIATMVDQSVGAGTELRGLRLCAADRLCGRVASVRGTERSVQFSPLTATLEKCHCNGVTSL